MIAILALGGAALAYFIIWTCRVYRHEGLRFWSKTTLKSVGKAVGFILLGIIAVAAFFVLVGIWKTCYLGLLLGEECDVALVGESIKLVMRMDVKH